MQFQELRSLVQIAMSGSIRAAAGALYLSPPAVHKQLRNLQQELGVRLYRRAGSRLELTEEGRAILPYARNALLQHDRAIAAVQELSGLRRGVLRIGCGPTTATYLLPALLKDFRARHPKIDIAVETGGTAQLLGSLREGSIDLTLIVEAEAGTEKELTEHCCWEFEIVPVAGPGRAARRCSIRKLATETFILFKAGGRIQQAIDGYFRKHGVNPRVAMRFDNADAVKAMVRGGFGISMLPYWTVASELRQRRVRLLRQSEPPLVARLVLASAGEAPATRAAEAFVKLARGYDGRLLDLRRGRAGPPAGGGPVRVGVVRK